MSNHILYHKHRKAGKLTELTNLSILKRGRRNSNHQPSDRQVDSSNSQYIE